MKKIIVFLTAVCLLAFTACGGSGPQPQPTVEPTPTVTPASDAQVVGDIEIAIEAALDYINENEDIDGATKFRNVILKRTSFEILFADKNTCEIKFKYPDAATFLSEASEMLEDSSSEEEIDAVLSQMADKMANDDIRLIKTVTAEVISRGDGTYTVVWNDDLYDAVSGGLHSAQEQEGE